VVPNASPFERDKSSSATSCWRSARASRAGASPTSTSSAARTNWSSTAPPTSIDGDGGAHPGAQAFRDALLVADFDPGTRRFTRIDWPPSKDDSREALAWHAIVRGIRDYCGKNGFTRAWLGLSGGVDSALVLALAAEALGPANVCAVRLPSRYTAGLVQRPGRRAGRKLGVELRTVSIAAPFEGFLQALAPSSPAAPPTSPKRTCSRAAAACC
jgi:hypothetical protein